MHCRARAGRNLATIVGTRAFWLKTLELIIIDKSCPRGTTTPHPELRTMYPVATGILRRVIRFLSPFKNLPQTLAPDKGAMIKVNIMGRSSSRRPATDGHHCRNGWSDWLVYCTGVIRSGWGIS